jgi:CRP-like cAMP-binding protein
MGDGLEESALARKLRHSLDFSNEDVAGIIALEEQELAVAPRTEIVAQDSGDPSYFVLLRGWAACSKLLPDGRRQIINFAVPGDFLGLRGFLLPKADHAIVTITEAKVSQFPRQRMLDLIRDNPRFGAAVLWALSFEQAIVVEHLVNIGRRSALERTAHLLLELEARLGLVGLSHDGQFEVPVTQEDLGDALGLTTVHVNRVLRQLRAQGLLATRQRRVEILDRDRLQELAQFTAGYLGHAAAGRLGQKGGAR